MASVESKVQNALSEAYILVLGLQILIGFTYRAHFEPGYARLAAVDRALELASLSLLLVSFCLLVLPVAHHQLIERGSDDARLHRFTTRVLDLALAPFALGLGLEFGVSMAPYSALARWVATVVATATAAGFWYALPLSARRLHPHPATEEGTMPTPLDEKIQHVLLESRMVLPGAQALLGFQLAVSLMDVFRDLPPSLRLLHVVNLGFLALSVVLLMTPAAWHRIVERGEATEHFHRIASRLVLASMAPLATGMAGDFYVVARRAELPRAAALAAALAALAMFLGAWFALPLLLRRRRERSLPGGARAQA